MKVMGNDIMLVDFNLPLLVLTLIISRTSLLSSSHFCFLFHLFVTLEPEEITLTDYWNERKKKKVKEIKLMEPPQHYPHHLTEKLSLCSVLPQEIAHCLFFIERTFS